MSVPLEPSPEQRAHLDDAVTRFAAAFLDRRPEADAHTLINDEDVVARLFAAPGERGESIDDMLALLDRALDTGIDPANGRFMSYIPTGGIYAGALGAYLGAVTNRYTGAAHANPGAVALEQGVIEWMIEVFGLPERSAGLLLSGGSIANLTAIVTARTRLGDDFSDGVVYVSSWAHHSVEKAARIAGIRAHRVRMIPDGPNHRIDTGALAAALAEDKASGLRPIMIAATAGVTDTGLVEPLDRCAEIAREYGAWFHVDAAYGGFFQLTERGRQRLIGISDADSITVDAHKSLLLPFGVGGLLTRDPDAMVRAHEGFGSYMRDVVDHGLPQFTFLGPELTRPQRGLMMWIALHLHGVAQFRDELDRMLDLAAMTADELRSMPGIEVVTEPELSILTFRSVHGDDATRHILDQVNDSGHAHLSSTEVDERMAIRMAFLSQRTTTEIVERALAEIRAAAA